MLSGFVLYKQIQTEWPGYLSFVFRRAIRLFPPCIVAVTASYLIYLFWAPAPAPNLSAWFNDTSWPAGITPDQYFQHLPLTGEDALLRPVWSLVYEWRVSLLIAAFILSPAVFSSLVFGAAIFLAKTSSWQTADYAWLLMTTFYASFFLAGIALSHFIEEVSAFLTDKPYLRYGLLALVIYYTDFRSQQSGLIGLVYVGLAAAGLIAVRISDRNVQRALEWRPLLSLGKISYSLYLWHMIVIGVLFRVLNGLPPLLIGALCMLCSVAIAAVMYRLTELPFVRLGRLYCAKCYQPNVAA
ncbi:acyltransferase family protein [Bradyrhizobium arachidis]|uniref:acyltransferase family protein n=1 Tax=Bradyrhizobium arachidis TaxID=858423 RepID=UPI001FCCC448|nr:acyltransferase [Bradyrhizobium arachidis]